MTYLDSISCEEEDSDKRHIIHYLNYGPFSSSTPTYDSTFANLTKKESDLVLSYYGNQNGFDYIQSLRAFVADGDNGLIKLVEDLANLWTANKHSEAQKIMKDAEVRNNPVKPSTSTVPGSTTTPTTSNPESQQPPLDFDALKSISDLGIDISFLDHFKQQDKTQQNLNTASRKITELNKIQSERLSQHPGQLDKVKMIHNQEKTTAGDLTTQLANLVGETTPGNVTDSSKLRQAMAVGPVPLSDKSGPLSVFVDKVLNEGEGKDGENITHDDALVHSVELGESPSEN